MCTQGIGGAKANYLIRTPHERTPMNSEIMALEGSAENLNYTTKALRKECVIKFLYALNPSVHTYVGIEEPQGPALGHNFVALGLGEGRPPLWVSL